MDWKVAVWPWFDNCSTCDDTPPSYEKGLDRDRHVSTSPWYMKQIVTIYYISSTSQYHVSSFVEEFLGIRRWNLDSLASLGAPKNAWSYRWCSLKEIFRDNLNLKSKFEIILVKTSNITCNMQPFLHTRSCWIFLNTQVLTPWCKTMCLDVGNKNGDL